ncbi:tyrosine-type recombinase/integrase [Listeria seeligeri]|uniref:tyrosine-type recombinase/integrase n=1 Tax=Listeria seeligeri TaxID=1640 RepID=UPI0022EBC6AF|nr:tyrosine-type recombinase/integrase [Listeria seeligeri]
MQKEHAKAIQEQDFDHYLFASRKKNEGERPLSRQQGCYIISNAGKKAGLQHLGTHSMRKTFGYHLYKKWHRFGINSAVVKPFFTKNNA